jgi:hypothetical protein
MKRLILFLACVSLCIVSCKQKTQQESQQGCKKECKHENSACCKDMQLCQSCGMPLSEEVYGTNADGSANKEYCKYCYANGAFIVPEMTMNEMIEVCVLHMVEQGMTEEQARQIMEQTLPMLKRWKQE